MRRCKKYLSLSCNGNQFISYNAMRHKIVFLDEGTIPGVDMTPITTLGSYTGFDNTPCDKIIDNCLGAEIIITNKVPLSAETIAQLPDLKLICVAATGMNNIDLDAAKDAGIEVKNAGNYSTHAVAEFTVLSVLALYRQIVFYDAYVKNGNYAQSSYFSNAEKETHELYGKKWGIIGLGNIGKNVANLATAFGCEVTYYSTSGEHDDPDYKRVELEELLSESDVISIHAPLTPKTFHMLDYHQFSLMKPTTIVVNVGRGSLINEDGLARALNDGLIAGAAIDVYSSEPITVDNPLNFVQDKYRLIASPHIAWSTKESLQQLINTVAENIKTYLSRKSPN